MQPPFNQEQQALYAQYARLGEQVAARAAACFKEASFDQVTWQNVCDQGLWELMAKDSGSWWNFSAALAGLASTAADGGFLLTCIAHATTIRLLYLHGSLLQQDSWLPQLRQGALSATAIAERQSGTDVPHVQTTAIQVPDGYLLSGEKWNIAHAPTAALSIVVSRVPDLGKRDSTLFLVDHRKPGVQAAPADEKLGNRTIPTAGLRFDAVALSPEDALGKPGSGLQVLADGVALGRVYYALCATKLLETAFELAWQFTAERTSFKQALHSHQYVQAKLTEVKATIYQNQALSYAALHEVLAGSPEATAIASAAKLTACRDFRKGCDLMLSLMGSEGYQEGPMARLAADSLGFMTVGGTEETQRMGIFNTLKRLSAKAPS